MNKLSLSNFGISFGNGDHLYVTTDLNQKKNTRMLIDSGFSLGIALPQFAVQELAFKDGFIADMVLADNSISKAFSFLAEVVVESSSQRIITGHLSVIFMKGVNEPMVGIEFLKLITPLYVDWGGKNITWGEKFQS